MARRPNLSPIESIMQKGDDFSMSGDEYERLTGVPLPKSDSYLQKDSAIAKRASDAGFQIEVAHEAVRTIRFIRQ